MTIDPSKIATRAAKAAVARQRSQGRSPVTNLYGFNGDAFQREYFRLGGDPDLYARSLRACEIGMLSTAPDQQLFTAHLHMIEAKSVMRSLMESSSTIREDFDPEHKEWCLQVLCWPEIMCDRLFPAFGAIEALQIDPAGQYRRDYERLLAGFNRAICSIDQKTRHLIGQGKWKARWPEYKAEITDFYVDEWQPFIHGLCERTGAYDQGLHERGNA